MKQVRLGSWVLLLFGCFSFFWNQTKCKAQVIEPADCISPTGQAIMDFNNVKALVEVGGLMWQDRSISRASYEVPAGSGVSSLYAGSFWAGGITQSGQLRLAANTFGGSGGDYSAGPLTAPYGGTNSARCLEYDKMYPSFRSDALTHVAYHQSLVDGTTEALFPDGYTAPGYFDQWPAHGHVDLGEDLYLAPFFDFDGDGTYDPDAGDAPGYGMDMSFCAPDDIGNRLSGDANWFWMFNDAGRVHTESEGEPMGIEVRAQSWVFSGAGPDFDNATFYTYQLLNQGPFELSDFRTAIWVDADVGNATDDYVGCDVQRGLGYAYNGDPHDEANVSSPGYGVNPPAVGVDFFYGLFQDSDGIDNPLTSNFSDAVDSLGIPYGGLGYGYGDGFVDNERLGMTGFVYYNNSNNAVSGEPNDPMDFYNYMRGFWKNGQRITYGGDGLSIASGDNLDIYSDYMFPGDSDPLHWGTGGQPVEAWSEVTAGNAPLDRRFLSSCGPVTFEPGERNELVFGVVWARGENGPESSVEALKEADDRIQTLFNNCFEGMGCTDPLASNYDAGALFGVNGSCTYPPLVCGEDLPTSYLTNLNEVSFEVEAVSATFGTLPQSVGVVLASGDSVSLVEVDGFPTGLGTDTGATWMSGSFACVPFWGAVAEVGEFNTTWTFVVWSEGESHPLDLSLVLTVEFDGNDVSDIVYPSIPLTRVEGRGSGRKKLRLSHATEMALLNSESGRLDEVTYAAGFGPLDVFLLSDSNLGHDYELAVTSLQDEDSLPFVLKDLTSGVVVSAHLSSAENVVNLEALGLAVAYDNPNLPSQSNYAEVLGSDVEYGSEEIWWKGISDQAGLSALNWIRSGTYEGDDLNPYSLVFSDLLDTDGQYDNVLDGTWAPYSVVAYTASDVEDIYTGLQFDHVPTVAPTRSSIVRVQQWDQPGATSSVKIVFSSDSAVWTRCPVLEMQPNPTLAQDETGGEGTLQKMNLRRHLSVDKRGLTVPEGGDPFECNLVSGSGMGWFPGYAIDTQTGERLNMAFGEDSWIVSQNGRDMLFNPGPQLNSEPLGSQVYAGGQHWVYVFKNGRHRSGVSNRMPAYDRGEFMMGQLLNPSLVNEKRVFRDCAWVGSALSTQNHDWSEPWEEFAFHFDVALPLEEYSASQPDVDVTDGSSNNWLPLYRFSTANLEGCTDPEAYNFDSSALVNDGSCFGQEEVCEANAQGFLNTQELGIFPSDTLFMNAEVMSFVLVVDGTVSFIDGQELSLASVTVDSVSGLPSELQFSGLEVGQLLTSDVCVEVEGGNLPSCATPTIHLSLQAAFFGSTIPAGSASLPLVICPPENAVEGCTYSGALNFMTSASIDDGSCVYVGCTDPEALNFNPLFSVDDGSCLFDDVGQECVGDIDLNGTVGTSDLLLVLTKFGETCIN